MPRYRKVDADVMTRRLKRATRGRPVSPEQESLVRRMRTITDETVVYEATLGPDEKPATLASSSCERPSSPTSRSR